MRSLAYFWVTMMVVISSVQGAGRNNVAVLSDLTKGLDGAIRVSVRDEVSGKVDSFKTRPAAKRVSNHRLGKISLSAKVSWSSDIHGLVMDMTFSGDKKRVGHEVTVELPMLKGRQEIFTASDRGVVSLAAYPSLKITSYGLFGQRSLRHYVLPLASVFDTDKDKALTVALTPTENIPHLQLEWEDAKVLRMVMKHRAMGGDKESTLRLRFYSHAADYRSVLKAYSDEFPRFFKPVMPRGEYEGAFWYHHIQRHPDFDEMSRQDIRYIWMSFWFTHLGEYMPDETEWAPYTFASWFKLGEMMSDEKIRAFLREMHDNGIGTYAYFNVTEYGGKGGAGGDKNKAERILREKFADALMKNKNGDVIPTWEGAIAMNAGRDYSLFPFLSEQVRRHIARLPELDGFIIDRLDWASMFDYGHHDGQTMVGDREVENMVWPVSEGVGEVVRQSHEAGKRVFVNMHWRIELLRDVDGTCHEADYLPGQGYLSPFRPSSSWHLAPYYRGDLLQLEGKLKNRLQYALLPQMIAHEFPISQQMADPEAADLLEIFTPLFATLDGKEQILLPHCVKATGSNDVNLFVNRDGQYVIPLTSRVRFLSRRVDATESVTVSLNVPDAKLVKWAYVISADSGVSELEVSHKAGKVEVVVPKHGTSSMVVLSKGVRPVLPKLDNVRFAKMRDRLFPLSKEVGQKISSCPKLTAVSKAMVYLKGVHIKYTEPISVMFDGKHVGQFSKEETALAVEWPGKVSKKWRPTITLTSGDDSVWFSPEEIELVVKLSDDKIVKVARWTPSQLVRKTGRHDQLFTLDWIKSEEMIAMKAEFEGRDVKLGGSWKGKLGTKGAWISGDIMDDQNGFAVRCNGTQHNWTGSNVVSDKRALQLKNGDPKLRKATCWFTDNEMVLNISRSNNEPYRLSIYMLDYDHADREQELLLYDQLGELVDRQKVSKQELAKGVYLTWEVTGPVAVKAKKLAGENAVVSGVFVDPL